MVLAVLPTHTKKADVRKQEHLANPLIPLVQTLANIGHQRTLNFQVHYTQSMKERARQSSPSSHQED